MTKQIKQAHSFVFKLALVERLLAGETIQELAVEAGLSSPEELKTWAQKYRATGRGARAARLRRENEWCGRKWRICGNCRP